MRVWFFSVRSLIMWLLICFSLGAYLALQTFPTVSVTTDLTNKISGKVVVIDPGHGGIDPGSSGESGVLEKEVALSIGHYLKNYLNQAAIFTIMTRDDDRDLADQEIEDLMDRKRQDLRRRVELANSKQADVYISIHANYFPITSLSGAQTFYYDKSEQDRLLAELIQKSLVEMLGPNHRQAKVGNYQVLRDTEMPSALVEVGFLSNPDEEALLYDTVYQEKVAFAMFTGIINYLTTDDH